MRLSNVLLGPDAWYLRTTQAPTPTPRGASQRKHHERLDSPRPPSPVWRCPSCPPDRLHRPWPWDPRQRPGPHASGLCSRSRQPRLRRQLLFLPGSTPPGASRPSDLRSRPREPCLRPRLRQLARSPRSPRSGLRPRPREPRLRSRLRELARSERAGLRPRTRASRLQPQVRQVAGSPCPGLRSRPRQPRLPERLRQLPRQGQDLGPRPRSPRLQPQLRALERDPSGSGRDSRPRRPPLQPQVPQVGTLVGSQPGLL